MTREGQALGLGRSALAGTRDMDPRMRRAFQGKLEADDFVSPLLVEDGRLDIDPLDAVDPVTDTGLSAPNTLAVGSFADADDATLATKINRLIEVQAGLIGLLSSALVSHNALLAQLEEKAYSRR